MTLNFSVDIGTSAHAGVTCGLPYNNQNLCGNFPQSYRQPDSFLRLQSNRLANSFGQQTPHSERRQYLYTEFAIWLPEHSTGASQPVPTTSTPPPVGPHSAQWQRDKNAGIQRANISTSVRSDQQYQHHH
jgi:hypothetical protein